MIAINETLFSKASAEVVGDIKAKTLTMEAGAIFVGKSAVGTPSTPAGTSSSTPAAKPAAAASPAPAAKPAETKSEPKAEQGNLSGVNP